jgi:hypothetical protein
MSKHSTIKIMMMAFAAIAVSLSSCKKDNDENPTTQTPATMGTLMFHLHSNIDTTEVDSGMVATDANGRHIQLNDARFFISGIKAKKSDGTWYSVGDVVLLKTMAEEEYVVASIPTGNYTQVAFEVGLSDAQNATLPSSYSSSNVLSTTDMFFGGSNGYKFLTIDGFADTTAAQTGVMDMPIHYDLGTNAERVSVTMPEENFTILTDNHTYFHLIVDYGVLLQGIDFKTQSQATPFSNPTVAQQLVGNVSNMIHLDE